MSDLQLLLVEDSPSDISTFESSLELFDDAHNIETDLKIADSFETALELIKENEFDGIIIDLSLNDDAEGGKEIIRTIIEEYKLIVPIIVYTGTPDDIAEYDYIETYQKGEREGLITEILTDFKKTKDFGLNDLFNAKGQIQDFLKDVFYKNIYHQKKQWIEYDDKKLVKNAILRHTLNHLTQHIDETDQKYFLEEMYIYPPISNTHKTGSIIKDNSDNKHHIILTPACDFAQSKARCILLAEIIAPFNFIQNNFPGNNASNNRKEKLEKFIRNGKQEYHYLPKLNDFNGGFIDFTSVKSYSVEELKNGFSEIKIQISPYFISDILGRFSSYYARQGQPDLHHKDSYITELLTQDTRQSS
ncbi:response regulator [Acinetobacter sp. ANC 4470]|uniref:response regulator n=1 Tax=Acinetobacter sp. ANC 4470 TaxID=1977881 RepID=UPI000A330F5A|nr:response regulator [Acinetobacter sp. ANC 4470]OTG63963.1 response regulator [Acinetobacter sp. ANC 4470]